MKRIFIIIFCISTLFAKSQILSWNTTPINCFTDTGTISLETMVPSPSLVWSFEDDLLGWISADTMQDIQFSINFDTLSTLRCGAYKVVANGGSPEFIFLGCPLGSRGEHFNVECFGDSTGMIKRVGHSGTPFSPPASPYMYEWFKDSLPFSAMDTIIDNLVPGVYSVRITDSLGCIDSLGNIIIEPEELIFGVISNIGPEDWGNKITTVGRNVPGVKIRIRDKNGNELISIKNGTIKIFNKENYEVVSVSADNKGQGNILLQRGGYVNTFNESGKKTTSLGENRSGEGTLSTFNNDAKLTSLLGGVSGGFGKLSLFDSRGKERLHLIQSLTTFNSDGKLTGKYGTNSNGDGSVLLYDKFGNRGWYKTGKSS